MFVHFNFVWVLDSRFVSLSYELAGVLQYRYILGLSWVGIWTQQAFLKEPVPVLPGKLLSAQSPGAVAHHSQAPCANVFPSRRESTESGLEIASGTHTQEVSVKVGSKVGKPFLLQKLIGKKCIWRCAKRQMPLMLKTLTTPKTHLHLCICCTCC